jgi:hypothetical protein
MKLLDTNMHVLSRSNEPMDYEAIAVELAKGQNIAEFGVMPRKVICSTIEDATAKEGDQCPIVRTEPGSYIAR